MTRYTARLAGWHGEGARCQDPGTAWSGSWCRRHPRVAQASGDTQNRPSVEVIIVGRFLADSRGSSSFALLRSSMAIRCAADRHLDRHRSKSSIGVKTTSPDPTKNPEDASIILSVSSFAGKVSKFAVGFRYGGRLRSCLEVNGVPWLPFSRAGPAMDFVTPSTFAK